MNFSQVDWSRPDRAVEPGPAVHPTGSSVPDVALRSTQGGSVNVSRLAGLTVLFIYPMTARLDPGLPAAWGTTPATHDASVQITGYRDHADQIAALGAHRMFGLSTQDTGYQAEAAARLHLPFPLLSDGELMLAHGLNLPMTVVEGILLLRRAALIIRNGIVVYSLPPIYPAGQDAAQIAAVLAERRL